MSVNPPIQHRRQLAGGWTGKFLRKGELGVELDPDPAQPSKIKIGPTGPTGGTAWASIPYFAGSTGPTGAASTVTGPTGSAGPTGSIGPGSGYMDKMAGMYQPGTNFKRIPTVNPDGTLSSETVYLADGTTKVFDCTFSNYSNGLPGTTVKRWYVGGTVPSDGQHILTETHTYDTYGNDTVDPAVWS